MHGFRGPHIPDAEQPTATDRRGLYGVVGTPTGGAGSRPWPSAAGPPSDAGPAPGHFFAASSKAARGVEDCGMPMMSRRDTALATQPATTAALRPTVGIAYTW